MIDSGTEVADAIAAAMVCVVLVGVVKQRRRGEDSDEDARTVMGGEGKKRVVMAKVQMKT